jgi:tripartite-type tricarboxylate transporter receptor subunit TctC
MAGNTAQSLRRPETFQRPDVRLGFCVGMIFTSCILAAPAQAQQTYPTRPIRFILPYATGGGTDIAARLFGQKLSEALGQQVVVDNRPGAGGIIGFDLAAKAAPDGHTLIMAAVNFTVLPSLHKKLPYDTIRDFAPVSMLTAYPHLLVVHQSLAATSVKELLALAKAKPGQINYASGGIGSVAHVAAELFTSMSNVNLVHVGYKGTGPALVGLLVGEAVVAFYSASATSQHIKAGRLRALAVTSGKRSPSLPDLPTIAEAGVPGYEAINWAGTLVPSGTPKPIIGRLHSELARMLQFPDVRKQLATLDFESVGNTPAEFDAIIRKEVMKWGKVVKVADQN